MQASQFRMATLTAVVALAFSGVALATPIAPGTYLDPMPAITAATAPWLAGTVIADESVPFSFQNMAGATISGEVQQRVVRENTAGTLDFYWRVSVDANAQAPVSYLRLGEFNGGSFDTYYRTDGLGDVAPYQAFRFNTPYANYVNYYFEQWDMVNGGNINQNLQPGKSSYFILIHTDATNYAKTALMDLADSGTMANSVGFNTYNPAPVPEPGTYALMLAGLGLLGMIARRRQVN
jgi:hypothetical protein